MKDKTKRKISIMIFLVMFMSIFSVFSFNNVNATEGLFPWDYPVNQYTMSGLNRTVFGGGTELVQQTGFLSLYRNNDAAFIMSNASINMRRFGDDAHNPVGNISLSIYEWSGEHMTPLGAYLGTATNIISNQELNHVNTKTPLAESSVWTLVTFYFNDIEIAENGNYIFRLDYNGQYEYGNIESGKSSCNANDYESIDFGCTAVAIHSRGTGGYDWQMWHLYSFTPTNINTYPLTQRNLVIMLNAQYEVTIPNSVNIEFNPYSHGKVYYSNSTWEYFPPDWRTEISSSGTSFTLQNNNYIYIYAIPDTGYYIKNINYTIQSEVYANFQSGFNIPCEYDITDINVNFALKSESFPENVSPDNFTVIIKSAYGGVVEYNVNGEYGTLEGMIKYYEGMTTWYRTTLNDFTKIYVRYTPYDGFQFGSHDLDAVIRRIYTVNGSLIEVYPYTDNSNGDNPYYWELPVTTFDFVTLGYSTLCTLSVTDIWVDTENPMPTQIPIPTNSPSPTPSLNPSVQRTFAIMDFLFGNNGILGTGFGLLVIIVCLIPCIIFSAFRNLWGFLGFFNVGVIITIATELIPIWILIVLVILDIAVILRNRLSGGSGDE